MLAPPGVAAARRVLGAQRGRHCPIDKLRAGVAGIYERQGAAYTSYHEGGGLRRSGYSSNNGVFYMLNDHLTSTAITTNSSGVRQTELRYFAYGGTC